jgi:hypothetical protein
MALKFDLAGNFIGGPDRMRANVVRPAADPRDAEIAALKARVAELEAALLAGNAVTPPPVTPVTPRSEARTLVTRTKLTPAEKQRRYRERKKAAG